MYIRIWIGNINKNSWCILSAFSEFCPWKGQETISKPMATNNPNVQILIFRNHFATKKEGKKKTEVPENGVDSISGTRYVQDEFEIWNSKKAIKNY